LVYNGEVFNYKEFKPELIAKGYAFKTQSDTEVLLYLLMEYGTKVLNRLIGFWAFALWNKKEERMLLVRDRLGVKPLFYSEQSESFVFASEPKAFFAGGMEKSVAEEHLDELFFYRHVSGENTIFKQVKRILPGHYMEVDNKGHIIHISRWFHLGEEAKAHPSIKNPLAWFEETFYSSIQSRMIADVPVGTMLSGGLDSSSVLYAQNHLGYTNTSNWNIGFPNFKDDESTIAQRFSALTGNPFYSFEYKADALVDLTRKAIHFSDEPFMHTQEPHLLGLCQHAKPHVSVLLSGEGADELMGGYVRYKVHDQPVRYKLLKMLRYVPDRFVKDERWRKMKKYLYMRNEPAQLMQNANIIYLKDLEKQELGGLNLIPEYRKKKLLEAIQYYPNNRLRQLLYLEQFTHLPTLNDRNDRVSMGASIENREPFEDFKLHTGVFSLPDQWFDTKGKGKKILMDSIGKKLPEFITKHRKIGLSIPWNEYMLENYYFKEKFMEMEKSPLFQMGHLNQLDVKKITNQYKNGFKEDHALVHQLFFLSLWYDEYFSGGQQ
jgi:asparagine synthase (glutamine-hydrolysing)